jgi:hypothetical protein
MTDKEEKTTIGDEAPRDAPTSPSALSVPDVDLPLPDPEAFSHFLKEIFAVVAEDIRREATAEAAPLSPSDATITP